MFRVQASNIIVRSSSLSCSLSVGLLEEGGGDEEEGEGEERQDQLGREGSEEDDVASNIFSVSLRPLRSGVTSGMPASLFNAGILSNCICTKLNELVVTQL